MLITDFLVLTKAHGMFIRTPKAKLSKKPVVEFLGEIGPSKVCATMSSLK